MSRLSYIDESCHAWKEMSNANVPQQHQCICHNRVAYFLKESCSRYEWVVSHMNKRCQMLTVHAAQQHQQICHNREAHFWMTCVSDMNESCHISSNHVSCECSSAASPNMPQCCDPFSEWVVFPKWMSHVTHGHEMSNVTAAQQHQRVCHNHVAYYGVASVSRID